MSLALAQLLPEFDLPVRGIMEASEDVSAEMTPAELDPFTVESIRSEALAEGRSQAEAELAARHAEEIAELTARHVAERKALVDELNVTIAQSVAASLEANANRITNLLSDELAAFLAPIVEESLARRTANALISEIRTALEAGNSERITVSGPEDWCSVMKTQLGEFEEKIDYRPGGDAEIEVIIDQACLKSRLKTLRGDIREALA